MEIKTQHKPGDEVWYITYQPVKLKKTTIVTIQSYFNGEVSWLLDAKEVNTRYWGYAPTTVPGMTASSNITQTQVVRKDSECFKTREEILNYLIED